MPLAIAFALFGFVLVASALKGRSVADLLREGLGVPFDPSAGAPESSSPVSSSGAPAGGGGGKVVELFYDPLGGWDCEGGSCVSIGAIGGHVDHVHVGGTRDALRDIEEQAKNQFRLNVSWDLNRPAGSHHAEGGEYDALDVSGNPRDMMAFARWVKQNYID